MTAVFILLSLVAFVLGVRQYLSGVLEDGR